MVLLLIWGKAELTEQILGQLAFMFQMCALKSAIERQKEKSRLKKEEIPKSIFITDGMNKKRMHGGRNSRTDYKFSRRNKPTNEVELLDKSSSRRYRSLL